MSDPQRPKRRRAGPLFALLLFFGPTAMCGTCLLLADGKGTVKDGTVLELDLRQPIGETSQGGLLSDGSLRTRDVVMTLEHAANDKRIVGLFAQLDGTGHGTATMMELHDAIIAFKKSGKRTVAFAETFGEMSPGTGGYVIASAFDDIWLQPQGNVGLSAMWTEQPYAKTAFDKAGVEVDIVARKEFKSAPEMFNRDSMSAAAKEATLAVLSSVQQHICTTIAAARPQVGDPQGSRINSQQAGDADAVCALLTEGPYGTVAAYDKKLVDHIGYRNEALAVAKGEGEAKLLWLQAYRAREKLADKKKGTKIAVITASGQIHQGPSNNDPLSGTQTVGSDTTAQALRRAVADKDIAGIILRIDSPGGSVVASETIAHEVRTAKAKGKPLVASMANVAGSGGYYIAMDAAAIVAQPTTITGSIGVYAGKQITAGLWEKVGVNFETLSVGDADASFYSTDMPYSDVAKGRLTNMVDGIYVSFVSAVAAGRGKSFDDIEPVARGRIWSGTDAKARGLVDELGGWPTTIAVMKEKLSLAADAPVVLVDYPKPKRPIEELLAQAQGSDGDSSEDAAAFTSRTHRIDAARAARAAIESAVAPVMLLSMPELGLR